MKQRITIEQLQELTEEQKNKLWDWWKPSTGDHVYPVDVDKDDFYCIYISNKKQSCVVLRDDIKEYLKLTHKRIPLLSIGQMIDLLCCKIKNTENSRLLMYQINLLTWSIEALHKDDTRWGDAHILKSSDSLCDALWQAVKEVL
jgi:polyphosphate kinase